MVLAQDNLQLPSRDAAPQVFQIQATVVGGVRPARVWAMDQSEAILNRSYTVRLCARPLRLRCCWLTAVVEPLSHALAHANLTLTSLQG